MASIREAPWNKRRFSKFSLVIFRSTGKKVLRGTATAASHQSLFLVPSPARPCSARSLLLELEFGGGGGVGWRLFADDLAVALVAMTLEAAGCASFQ